MSYDCVIQSKSRKLVNELDNNMRLIFKLSPSAVFPTQSFKDLHDLMLWSLCESPLQHLNRLTIFNSPIATYVANIQIYLTLV